MMQTNFKNKGGKFFSLRLLVSYKALLKPTFYYHVSIYLAICTLSLKGKFEDYQLTTLLDSKNESRNNQSDVVFLCQNELILVD